MSPVLPVIVLAMGWHIGILWIERSRLSCFEKPSLTKLLQLVELDLLRTLRTELTRLLRTKPKPRYERKLQEVDRWLQRLGGHYAN